MIYQAGKLNTFLKHLALIGQENGQLQWAGTKQEWAKVPNSPEYDIVTELRNDKIMAEKSDLVDEIPEPLRSDYQ